MLRKEGTSTINGCPFFLKMSERIYGFAPVVGKNPRILILGSMPSVASLEQVQYYGHPRNAFWKIQAALFHEEYTENYEERILRLKTHGIALWDSVSSCVRPGSLDSAITDVIPNDIALLLHENPTIGHIFFNGNASRQIFLRHHKQLKAFPSTLLPSTSPAAAMYTLEQKLAAWRCIKDHL